MSVIGWEGNRHFLLNPHIAIYSNSIKRFVRQTKSQALTCINDIAYKGEIMAYNEELEARIKQVVARWKNTTNRKMFGVVCHLISGNMFCGVHKNSMILRLGEETAREALAANHVREFDITGKPMKGWVMVAESGYKGEKELKDWLNKAKKFARTLPAK